MSDSAFSRFIRRIRTSGELAVQPRMGWGSPRLMRQGLEAVKAESRNCIGTLTLDSYTRTGDYLSPLVCIRNGDDLNGYPIMSHPPETTRAILDGVCDESFPVQVRHGTPQPQAIFRRLVTVGLDAIEGGPVSYCLPYGRTPLSTSMAAWSESCEILAGEREHGHIESFGGCLMGQMCPPAMLLATTLLECAFFRQHGIRSVSLSYTQGPSYAQDRAALTLLRDLAAVYLPDTEWHVVLYTYMGVFPQSDSGAARLLEDSARLAVESGCERLIVKTKSERHQIPPLVHNLAALRLALQAAGTTQRKPLRAEEQACHEELSQDVRTLVDEVLNLDANLSRALLSAFRHGVLDVPYCLHPDNRGRARAAIDPDGFLRWTRRGNVPVRESLPHLEAAFSSRTLLAQLHYVANSFDALQSSDHRIGQASSRWNR